MEHVDRDRLAEVCRQYGIGRLQIFGSVATGSAVEGSDIDVLYTLSPGVRLGWEIDAMADSLSDILGAPVDLVSSRALHPMIREAALAQAKPLYDAA